MQATLPVVALTLQAWVSWPFLSCAQSDSEGVEQLVKRTEAGLDHVSALPPTS
jgi:hypothetical protein